MQKDIEEIVSNGIQQVNQQAFDRVIFKDEIEMMQRYFDWKREHARDFIKSIFLDYYVGALLLWDVRKETELEVMQVKF